MIPVTAKVRTGYLVPHRIESVMICSLKLSNRVKKDSVKVRVLINSALRAEGTLDRIGAFELGRQLEGSGTGSSLKLVTKKPSSLSQKSGLPLEVRVTYFIAVARRQGSQVVFSIVPLSGTVMSGKLSRPRSVSRTGDLVSSVMRMVWDHVVSDKNSSELREPETLPDSEH